jgi:HEAT repeat protein
LPFLAVRSADPSPDVRFWATYLLGDLQYPDAAMALWPRLFDEDGSVRRIAVHSARALVGVGEVGAPIRSGIERVVKNRQEVELRRLTAIMMIGELRLYGLIPVLIEALEGNSAPITSAAAQTLETLARQDYGTDARRWNSWWQSKGRSRFASQ